MNRVLTEYTGLIEAARANNRQGFPVGAAYLRQASRVLAGGRAAPARARWCASNSNGCKRRSRRGDTAARRSGPSCWCSRSAALVGGADLSLGEDAPHVQPAAGRRDRHRARRRPGRPRRAGLGAVERRTTPATVRTGRRSRSPAPASTRFDAKSAEALALIARGSGRGRSRSGSAPRRPAASATRCRTLRSSTRRARAVSERAPAVRRPARRGARASTTAGSTTRRWPQRPGPAAANAAFAAVRAGRRPGRSRPRRPISPTTSTTRPRRCCRRPGWSLLAGLAAAVLAWRGMSQRLREYR